MGRNLQSSNKENTRRVVLVGIIAVALLLLLGLISAYFIQSRSQPGSQHVFSSVPGLPPITCKTPAHSPGESTVKISSGGVQRTFLLHLPPSYGRQPQALVISYHGYSWTSQIMKQNTHLDGEADKAGFVLVFPQGLDDPPSWNAGENTGDADDIQFTQDMLNYLKKNYCIDAKRVYLNGFSLGGGMAFRAACALTDQVAAIATVSGAYYPIPGGCQASRPLPVMEIHGAADDLAPYTGNPSIGMASVHNYLQGWRDIDKCDGTANVFFDKGDVTGMDWTRCAPHVEIVHYRISDGKHTWPGSPNTTHVIDANVVIWDFFSHYTLQ